jgi:hypothetical protein
VTHPYFVARQRAMNLILGRPVKEQTTVTDLARYLADWQNTPSYWRQYIFPNGRAANVVVDPIPQDPAHQFRFQVEYDGEDGMFTAPGLSTAEVEAKLAEVAALPVHNPTT